MCRVCKRKLATSIKGPSASKETSGAWGNRIRWSSYPIAHGPARYVSTEGIRYVNTEEGAGALGGIGCGACADVPDDHIR